MKNRVVDEEIVLVRYYPNYKTTLAWYQDLDLCKQVDNRDTVYDLELLKCMYNYLNKHGDLFYIKYKNRLHLCRFVCPLSMNTLAASFRLGRLCVILPERSRISAISVALRCFRMRNSRGFFLI